MESAQIGDLGERYTEMALKAKGWKCKRNTKLPGSTDIEARGAKKKLLVQVKTSIAPGQPSDLSADEKRNIKARAALIGAEAWLARIQVNAKGALVFGPAWTRLT